MQLAAVSNPISFPWYLQTFIITFWDLISEGNHFKWREEIFQSWPLTAQPPEVEVILLRGSIVFVIRKFVWISTHKESLKKWHIVKCSHPICWVVSLITELQNCNCSRAKSSFDSSVVPDSAYSDFWDFLIFFPFGYSDLSFFGLANLSMRQQSYFLRMCNETPAIFAKTAFHLKKPL